jgi:bifunctional non-homologous end joining protein LigD
MPPRAKRNARRPQQGSPEQSADAGDEVAAVADLAEYDERRDFEKTPEPAPEDELLGSVEGPLTFVVQKHRATRMHYDVRLEVDGVLKSWPVPRGPSPDPAEKRLAVQTEDHPFDYGTFEGLIPKGEYGAGEVIVWDRGTYSPDEHGLVFDDREEAQRQMREQIEAQKLSITFRGSKLKGSYTLVKTSQSDNSWLMIKHRDDSAQPGVDLTEQNASVISGLTIEDLQAGRQVPAESEPEPLHAHELRGAKRAKLPKQLEPMQATLTKDPFANEDWLFEPKLDGVRAIVTLTDGAVTLRSRRGNDMTKQYPTLAAVLGRQPAETMILDGEIVAVDEQGVPSFELLQQRLNLQNEHEIAQADHDLPVLFYAFDLLYLDGVDLTRVPLEERARLLTRTLAPSAWVKHLEAFEVDGLTAFEAVRNLGLEGLVAKKRDSKYSPGRRSKQWLKVKHRPADEFVVVGYSDGERSRASTFGSLVIATRDKAGGELVAAGRAGSGFTDRGLEEALERLEPLIVAEAPLDETQVERVFAYGNDVTWVRPELVVEVEYAEVTSDGNLRAPVFKRFRDDKPAEDVVRQATSSAPAARKRASVPSRSPGSAVSSTLEADVASVLEQVESLRKERVIDVGGVPVKVTNLDKEMWPAANLGGAVGEQRALTKRDLIAYYARMAHVIIPQIRNRPLTMTRYPNGVEESYFYQKHVEHLPGDFVETVMVHAGGDDEGSDQEYVLVNNLPTLVWLAQMADLALHTSLARVDPTPDATHLSTDFTGSREQIRQSVLNYPDFVLCDLDPYIYAGTEGKGEEPELNQKAFERTSEVAQWLKELLDGAGLSSFVKTSGATGLHIYVPVLRQYEYETIRGVAQTFANFLVTQHPKVVTTEWVSENRRGKIFFDINQNARIKNLACAYSPRSKPGAPVSMPLRWDELGKVWPTDWTILNAHERLAEVGDLWAHILDSKNDLQSLVEG